MTTCRLCGSTNMESVVDLGATPPCERFLTVEQLAEPEITYPLHLQVCTDCWLAQIPPLITPEDTFTEYAYFSSFSESWVEHARRFVRDAAERVGLDESSFVVEVASNDGYLLRHVVAQGIPCLGVEPSVNVGQAARDGGVPTLTAFLSPETGAAVRAEHGPANLVVANNVYAHIPDVIGFTQGLRALVADDGWVSIEVQHLLTLIEKTQYDTIYHEHFQYYTVESARQALATGGLSLVDVELLPTHGGSIRLWARPAEVAGAPSPRMVDALAAEKAAGLHELAGYTEFAARVARVRRDLLKFLVAAAEEGKTVVGYGAPGKGNTLLNHCGIRPDLLAYTVDRNPYKHGRYTPGTRIPVLPPERIAADRPDYVLVLPWNLRAELSQQLSYVEEWGGKLVFPIPHLEIVEGKSS
ncbi:class I SAM-dependent methyltransferase [Amycolatopsis acidiphila]|uniref:Class I SAM-dependent methyltransferase n=1 Tax=Amycolatopsis acidiphila TaxID=715473 RepID=A0A558A5T3_9PSEU|nr:class I SAM-dependent methyltransferase [Amycolatopsis acidiphila]TVT19588.1 class I SAM-dependent methyltransferase [Amycolatopsis acidiphila]UIJ60564.1 class I SAM-dependent methyltransferase [Amycolatopsis acidiphila]GHG82099.1 methyltransferase [Amycolatopsis acidiphila]